MKLKKPRLNIISLFIALLTSASAQAGVVTNLIVLPVASSMTEGIAASNVTVASFTDPGSVPLGTFEAVKSSLGRVVDDITNYTVVIDWGDGLTNDAGTLVLNGLGGLDVVGTHTYMAAGTNWINVFISDVDGSQGSTTSEAIVSDAPLCAHGTSAGAIEGILFTGQVATFHDKNVFAPVDDFTATIDWGDQSESVGNVTSLGAGKFAVGGSHTYPQIGSYAIKVKIQDKGGSQASAGTTIAVTEATLIAAGKTINPVEGVLFNGEVATFSDANILEPLKTYVATILWGDAQSSFGSVTMIEPGSFSVTGTHVFSEEGSYAMTILILEDNNCATAGSTAVVGDAPLSGEGTGITPVEGASFTLPVATFRDANPNAVTNEFTAAIDWGDGSDPSFGSIVAADSSFKVVGTHTYIDEGSFAITVQIKDIGGSTAAASSTATVLDAPLSASGMNVSGVEGTTISNVVATFTDANPFGQQSEYSAVIAWGDGNTNMGVISAASLGVYNVSGTHTYTEHGSFALTVNISDKGGSLVSAGASAQIADAALSSIGRGIMPVEKTAFIAIVASVTDANPYGTTNDLSASIDWGDGTGSSGTIIATTTPAEYDVVGSHTYAAQGLYPIVVTVSDVGGATTISHSIADATEPQMVATGATINAIKGTAFAGVVASCTHPDPTPELTNSYSCIVNWGDGTTSPGTMLVDEASTTSMGCYSIFATHTYAQPGNYMVLVTIDDKLNYVSTSARSAALVSEAPAANVTPQFQIKATRPKFDKRTGWVKQVLTVKNLSGKPITGPISVVFDSLQNESGVIHLANEDGEIKTAAAAPMGSPYKNLPLQRKNLLNNKENKAITVYFDGRSENINYTVRILAGTGAR